MTETAPSLIRNFRMRYNLPPNSPVILEHSIDDMFIDHIQWLIEQYREEHPDLRFEDIQFGDIFSSADPNGFEAVLADTQKRFPHLDLHDAVEMARKELKRRIGAQDGRTK